MIHTYVLHHVPIACPGLLCTGSGLRISKFRRLSQPDDKLGDGIDYTYVEDKSKFVTDKATLRYASVSVLMDRSVAAVFSFQFIWETNN